MSAETGNIIGVFIGTHGNEMEVGGRLKSKLDTNSIGNVTYRIAHPAAVAAEERYLGTRQIMSRYPGKPEGDPEERAAYNNLQWRRRVKPRVIFDIHETTVSGSSYFAVGEKTTVPALAGAKKFDMNSCIVSTQPFYRYVPEGVSLENSLADNTPEALAENLYEGLVNVASANLLEMPFDEAIKDITFYQNFDITSVVPDGQTAPYLEALEDIPKTPRFSLLDLSPELRQSLSIPSEAQLVYNSWGHANMSKLAPERLGYTATGVPRREWFGDYMVRIAPPVLTDGGYVIFQRESRPFSQKQQGLLQLAT